MTARHRILALAAVVVSSGVLAGCGRTYALVAPDAAVPRYLPYIYFVKQTSSTSEMEKCTIRPDNSVTCAGVASREQ